MRPWWFGGLDEFICSALLWSIIIETKQKNGGVPNSMHSSAMGNIIGKESLYQFLAL
jgi:hypothetical protein